MSTSETHSKKLTRIDDNVQNVGSNITSGNDMALDAASDINIIGSKLEGENGSITSQAGNVNIKNANYLVSCIRRVFERGVAGYQRRLANDLTLIAKYIS